MHKGLIIGLAGVILGCLGVGYALVDGRKNETSGEIDKQANEVVDVVRKIHKGVKRSMSQKVEITKEYIQVGRDILTSRPQRAVLGIAITCLGVGLIASAYMPLPA